jgi:hypothetical protein
LKQIERTPIRSAQGRPGLKSKVAFNFLMQLFSLTETAEDKAAAPIVTVPAR